MITWNIDKDWLEEKYIKEQLTTRQVAKLVGCCSHTISLKLKEFGIPARTRESSMSKYKIGSEVECLVCHKKVYRKKNQLEKYNKFFCSWKCAKEFQSISRKSTLALGWRRFREYRIWRRQVLSRDKVCRLCGSDNKLTAHHILEAQKYPELIYEVSNGVTLCQSCHTKIHKKDSTTFIKSLQEAILVE